jgi:hypothetical protein
MIVIKFELFSLENCNTYKVIDFFGESKKLTVQMLNSKTVMIIIIKERFLIIYSIVSYPSIIT